MLGATKAGPDELARDKALMHIFHEHALPVPAYRALTRTSRAFRDTARLDAQDVWVIVRTYLASLVCGTLPQKIQSISELVALASRADGRVHAGVVLRALAEVLRQQPPVNRVLQSLAGRGVVRIAEVTNDGQVRQKAFDIVKDFVTRPQADEASQQSTGRPVNELAATLMMVDLLDMRPSPDSIGTLMEISASAGAAWNLGAVGVKVRGFSRACEPIAIDRDAVRNAFWRQNIKMGRYGRNDPVAMSLISDFGNYMISFSDEDRPAMDVYESVLREEIDQTLGQTLGGGVAAVVQPRADSQRKSILAPEISAARETLLAWFEAQTPWIKEDLGSVRDFERAQAALVGPEFMFGDISGADAVEDTLKHLSMGRFSDVAEDFIDDFRRCIAAERLARCSDRQVLQRFSQRKSKLRSAEVSSCFARWFLGQSTERVRLRDGRLEEFFASQGLLRLAGYFHLIQVITRVKP